MWIWLYPELERLERDADRTRVLAEASRHVSLVPRIWGSATLAVIIAAMISFSVTELARIAHIPTFATALVKGAFTGVLTVFLIDYFMRRPVQRRIRMALDAMGMPTCIACGYDLRGQTEPRCPECGAAYSGTLPSEREPSGESLSK